jgi:hypothetical protein
MKVSRLIALVQPVGQHYEHYEPDERDRADTLDPSRRLPFGCRLYKDMPSVSAPQTPERMLIGARHPARRKQQGGRRSNLSRPVRSSTSQSTRLRTDDAP